MKTNTIAIVICAFALLSFTFISNTIYWNEVKPITVESDPGKVEKTREKISSLIAENAKLYAKSNKYQILCEKYYAGDKSTIPEIHKYIQSDNEDEFKAISQSLQNSISYDAKKPVFEKEICDAYYALLYNDKHQDNSIQTIGYLQFTNYQIELEKLLFSGKCKDISRTLYWLGLEGSSVKSWEFLKTKILDKNYDFSKPEWDFSTLEGFSKSKNSVIQKDAIDFCLSLYNNKTIPKTQFEELGNSFSSSNSAYTVLQILFSTDDPRIVPIAYEMLSKQIMAYYAFPALIRIEGVKHKGKVMRDLRDRDAFLSTIDYAKVLYNVTKDTTVLNEILVQFAKNEKPEPYECDRIAEILIDTKAFNYFDKLEMYIKNPKTNVRIRKTYEISKGNAVSFAHELESMGVVNTPFSKEILNKAAAIQADEPRSYMNVFLEMSGIMTPIIAAESGDYPIQYDRILTELFKNSNGKLKDILVYNEVGGNINEYDVNYTISIVANNKVYTMKLPESGDSPDIESLVALVNRVASDAGLKERYVVLGNDDYYAQVLFGFEDKIKLLKEKYFNE